MLKGGLVGLGRMGLTHLAILNTHPDVRWTAVCDTTPFVLKNLQQRLGFQAFSDHKSMLKEADVDFVVVATPTASHADVIRAALERRLHLFVEKPLTLSGAESRAVADAAARAGVVTQVGYVNRFNEVFTAARRVVERGLLGRLVHFKCDMNGRTVLHPTKVGWRSKKTEGGGCLYEFASHAVDLTTFLVGAPDDVVGSRMASIYSVAVDDAVYSTFVYREGLTGQIAVNWSDESYRRPHNRIEIFGTAGKLIVDQQELRVYLRHDDDSGEWEKGWNVRYITDLERPTRFYLRGNEFTLQLDHFVECVRTKAGSPVSSFETAATTDQLLERIAAESRMRG